MIGYILIGAFAIVLIYISVLYFINSKKIKKQQGQKTKKEVEKADKQDKAKQKAESGAKEKVEVKSTVVQGTVADEALKEAEYENNLKEAFEKVEKDVAKQKDTSKLARECLSRNKEMFTTELDQRQTTISSFTNTMGHEGPDAEIIAKINKEIADEDKAEQKPQKPSLKSEVDNLSPEMKALLLNDILNRKYWIIKNSQA